MNTAKDKAVAKLVGELRAIGGRNELWHGIRQPCLAAADLIEWYQRGTGEVPADAAEADEK